MTVPNQTNEWSYTGNGLVDTYPYTARIFQDADLVVTVVSPLGVLSTLVLNTDYTVTGALSYSGGNVVLTAPLADLAVITISRDPAEVQNTALRDQQAYLAQAVENGFDLVTMMIQALRTILSRALVLPPGSTASVALPPPVATDLLGWDPTGTFLTNWSQAAVAAVNNAIQPTVDSFLAGADFTPGVTTLLTLSEDPLSILNTTIAFDGTLQHQSTYSISGSDVTFSSPIPLGVLAVQVVQYPKVVFPVPADGSITAAKLADNAVTAAKILADAVTTAKILDANVTTAKLADRSVTLAKLAAGATQGGKNAIINGDAIIANGVDYAATVSGDYDYGLSPLCQGALTGTTVAGSLTQSATSSLGRTGRSFKWSAVTTTGSGIAKWRFFVEARDASRFKNQTATVSCQGRQDTGAAVDFAIVVSKANATDDFSATTVISNGGNISVPSATNGSVYNRGIAMGDCSNGIMVEITANIGVVTNKNAEITEVQLEFGSYETDFEYESVALTTVKVARYYETFGSIAAGFTGMVAPGFAISATQGGAVFYYEEKRIAPTITVTSPTGFITVDTTGASIACATVTGGLGAKTYISMSFTVAAGLTAGQGTILAANGATSQIVVDARF
jgi:hypothetical protein